VGAHGKGVDAERGLVRTGDLPTLCLDFTDTVGWRDSGHPTEGLEGFEDLVKWSGRKGILGREEGERMAEMARQDRRGAEDVLTQAKLLREAVYRIFRGAADGKRARADDLAVLNGFLGRSLSRMEVVQTESGYSWGWCSGESMDRMLYPIARSAGILLTSEDLVKVKMCANDQEGCGSLFVDSSKSRTRRWCDMKSCGNRAKFRTYYDRHMRTKVATVS
jgi:predicted RNA-binding Zn ribbon-like protein